MDAIVIAGGIPNPEDPLYSYVKGDAKALVDIAGKPMVQWVLDALGESKRVDNVIIVGLSPKNQLTCKKPLHFLSNQGRMLDNIIVGVNKSLELNKKNKYVLIVSSDIPALKAHMVDWLVDTCMQTKDDLYYGFCPREVMEARFPDSKRTFTRLKDIELCGGDMHITHVRMAAAENLDLWEQLIGNRKSPLRQARIIGLDIFFQVGFHTITLSDLETKVVSRLARKVREMKGRAIRYPFAEPAMDVDKPHQFELLRADLAKQQRKAQPKRKSAPKKMKKASAVKKVAARVRSKPRRR
jgi:GTP:adenosylcobinamide-phosphate guanylyltransferase